MKNFLPSTSLFYHFLNRDLIAAKGIKTDFFSNDYIKNYLSLHLTVHAISSELTWYQTHWPSNKECDYRKSYLFTNSFYHKTGAYLCLTRTLSPIQFHWREGIKDIKINLQPSLKNLSFWCSGLLIIFININEKDTINGHRFDK